MKEKRKRTRVQRFLSALEGAPEVFILTHENPDPDAIASGWGLAVLVDQKLQVPVHLIAGGVISRAENRALVDTLRPPLRLVESWSPPEHAALVVVDVAFLPRLASMPVQFPLAAVVDHHEPEKKNQRQFSFRFRDVRPKVVAASSMVAGYLRECGIQPSAPLATALTYGIYSDAKASFAKFTRADTLALSWLVQFSDQEALRRIENATLPRKYFEDFLLALENCFIYDKVGLCFLPQASCVEAVGEFADLLIRCQDIDRLLCAARIIDRVLFSARTTTQGGNAVEFLGKTFKGEAGASWGGHEHRAGGSIDLKQSPLSPSDVEAKIRQNWLLANGMDGSRGVRLVAKREILKALE